MGENWNVQVPGMHSDKARAGGANCGPCSSKPANPFMFFVVSAGLFALLTLSSCAQAAPEVPNNTPSAAAPDARGAGHAGDRTAAAIFDDFMMTAAAAVEATDTAGWTYEDGSPWNPEAPDIVFNPKPCGEGADGQRMMQFVLIGPAPADPEGARDTMQGYLQGLANQGYTVSRSMDPAAGSAPKNTYVVGASRADGAYIDYGSNDGGQRLNLGSECSSHPSLGGEVSAQTD